MNPIRSWNRLFFAPISARPLGAFRIVFGVLMLMYLGLMTVEFDLWYTGTRLAARRRKRAKRPVLFASPCFSSPITRVRSPMPSGPRPPRRQLGSLSAGEPG